MDNNRLIVSDDLVSQFDSNVSQHVRNKKFDICSAPQSQVSSYEIHLWDFKADQLKTPNTPNGPTLQH